MYGQFWSHNLAVVIIMPLTFTLCRSWTTQYYCGAAVINPSLVKLAAVSQAEFTVVIYRHAGRMILQCLHSMRWLGPHRASMLVPVIHFFLYSLYRLLHLFKSLLRATSSMIRGSPSSGTSKKVQKKRQ